MLIEQGCENATYQFICISFIKGFMDYATSAMNAKVLKKERYQTICEKSFYICNEKYKKTHDIKRSFQHENQKGGCTLRTVS